MVSIRRRPGRNSVHKPGHPGSSSSISNHKWRVLFRSFLGLVIGTQSILLIYKLAVVPIMSTTKITTTTKRTNVPPSSSLSLTSLTDVLHQKRRESTNNNSNIRKNNPKLEPNEPEQQQQQNQQKPPPMVPHDFENKHHTNPDDDPESHTNMVDHDEKQPKQQQQQPQPQPDVLTQRGSGPAKLGYVMDLVQERNVAAFRQPPLPSSSTSRGLWTAEYYQQRAASTVGGGPEKKKWQACEYAVGMDPEDNNHHHHDRNPLFRQRKQCRNDDPDVHLTAYNPAPFSRYLCGHEIPPGTTLAVPHSVDNSSNNDHCDPSVVHLLLPSKHRVPLDGKDMPDIVVQTKKKDGTHAKSLDRIDCDIPCLYDKELLDTAASTSSNVAVATIVGTDWTLTQTKADPTYQSQANIDRTDYRRDQYYSTTSFRSSVPLSYYDSHKYRDALHHTPSLSWDQLEARATYLLDQDCTAMRRNKWYAAVAAVMDVQAYGSCEHNTALPAGIDLAQAQHRIQLMQKNRIVLVLEAGTEKDHITESVWEALLAGVVPAIYGATNLEKRLPRNAAIYASKFNSWDKFAEYIQQVSNDRQLWESFHEWRTDETALQQWAQELAFTDTSPECRVCRWAYAKRYGLGWNHTQQVIQETVLPRVLCHGTTKDDSVVVTQPFREVWTGMPPSSVSAMMPEETCSTNVLRGEFTLHDFVVERKVVEHDGVIDLILQRIERTSGGDKNRELVLRLELDGVHNTDGAHFPDTHTTTTIPTTTTSSSNNINPPGVLRSFAVSSATIQDERSKVTVLANWVTQVRSPGAGVIEVVVLSLEENKLPDDEQKRIRVILEDLNPLHDKMTEFFPSSFGKIMMYDFIEPLELYYEG